MREVIPGGMVSDEARTFYIRTLTELAAEIGPQAFQQVVVKVVNTCERRPTIATWRRLAGLSMDTPTAAVLAWEVVTAVVVRHVKRDGNGSAVLEPKTLIVDGKAMIEPVPELSKAISSTVRAMGGWGALADSYPQWWGQRWQNFKEIYHF